MSMSIGTPKVEQLYNDNHNPVANHFIVRTFQGKTYFQSYDSIVFCLDYSDHSANKIKYIFGSDWDYSKTTWKWLRYYLMHTFTKRTLYELFETDDVRMDDVRKAFSRGTVEYNESMR